MKKLIILTIILFTVQFLAPIFAQTEQKPRLVVQTGHFDVINALAYSPDGKVLASGGGDNLIKLWNTEKGLEIGQVGFNLSSISSISFSPDGKIIAAIGNDGLITLYDPINKFLLGMARAVDAETNLLSRNHYKLFSIKFSSDGRYLVSSCVREKTIKIWDVKTLIDFKEKTPKLILQNGLHTVNSIDISDDGSTLVSNSKGDDENQEIKIWSLSDGQLKKTIKTGSSGFGFISISPNGKFIASDNAKGKGLITIWDGNSGKQLKKLENTKYSSFPAFKFSLDGKTLASISNLAGFGVATREITLWNIDTEQIKKTIEGFPGSITFNPDGSELAFTDFKHIKIYKLNSESTTIFEVNLIQTLPRFSVDGEKLILGKDKAYWQIFDLKSGIVNKNIKDFDVWADLITNMKSWDAKTGKETSDDDTKAFKELGISLFVVARLISPDQKKQLFFNQNEVIVKSLETEKELFRLSGHTDKVATVDFSPDGKIIITGSHDNTIKLWDAESGELIRNLDGYQPAVFGFFDENKSQTNFCTISFDEKGEIIAGTGDDEAKVWAVTNGIEIVSFEHKEVITVAISEDGKLLATGNGESDESQIKIWDIKNKKELFSLKGHTDDILAINFSQNNKFLVSGSKDNSIKLWNLETQKEIRTFNGHLGNVHLVGLDENTIFSESIDQTLMSWDMENDKKGFTFGEVDDVLMGWAISPDRKFLAQKDTAGIIKIWDIAKEKKLHEIIDPYTKSVPLPSNVNTGYDVLAFSNDGKFATLSEDDYTNEKVTIKLKIWNIKNKKAEFIKGWSKENQSHWETENLRFSPDGRFLAIVIDSELWLWDLELQKEPVLLYGKNANLIVTSVEFTPNNKELLIGMDVLLDGVGNMKSSAILRHKLDGKTPQEITEENIFGVNDSSIWHLSFNSSGKFLVSQGSSAITKIWDVENKNHIASIVVLANDDWVITTPEGRFDTNKLENPQGLHWIMPDAPFVPLSFEVFMRDYYEPNLLPRLLKCTENGNCDKDTDSLPREFKPVRNLTALNRTQPKIKISNIKPIAPDEVELVVEAEDATSEYQKDKQNQPLHSGIFDLRLFRDGQLVGYSTADEKLQNTFRTYANFDEELKVWQEANKVELVNGKKTFTFRVQLPKNRDAKEFKLRNQDEKEFEFSAYAFNVDRVKSETARETYKSEKPLPMAKGNAYIVTIGVNANETGSLRLNYAANDARRLPEELAKNLPKDRYKEIVQIQLISDFDKDGKLSENNATKAKIKAVLDRLAGKNVSNDALKDLPNATLLKKVLPEDLVLIAFSGHGYASREGIFYLIPYDIGATANGGLGSVLQKSISSDELSLWLRDIDAGEMMMIVDACHSAAAVQGKDFKPGPMGSRGLGQLSYDKGMRILTATQADNVALELGKLQHGLLTYSLITNGLECGLADYQPKDNKLFSNEWLSFAVKDVPLLYEKALKGELNYCEAAKAGDLNKWLLINGEKPKGVEVINLDGQKSNLNLQQPSLFDFSRRDRQFELLNIGLIAK